MPSIKNPGPKSVDGPITFADVLACVAADETGVLQADATNAGAIRAQLGRGSTSTVQRHLDGIRAELAAAAAPQPTGATPTAPAEAVAAMWAAAWAAAQADMLGRLDRMTVERDQARARIDVLTADRDAATAEADEQREHAAAAAAACDDATMLLADKETELEARVAAANAALSAAEAALVREREQAQHAAALVSREREIERQALQGQIDRLQERVAELRALEIWAASQKKAGNDSPD
jgi:hypothetical protein